MTSREELARGERAVHPANDLPCTRTLLAGARARTHARLARAFAFPIAVVSAPDGYDQALVVRDALRANGRAYRSVDIDPLEGNVLGVLRALGRAVGDTLPAMASSFVTVYDRVADSPDAADQLAIWAADTLTSLETTLVVEGLDAVTDERVAKLLSSLVDRTHAGIRWILILAGSEQFPIARWLAEERLDLPIDQTDLALTEHDLDGIRGDDLDPRDRGRLVKLCTLTGGWPAAIALGMAAGAAVDLDAAPVDRAACYHYLAEALLARLPERDRAFIEATCLFRTFDSALLECAGHFDVSQTLDGPAGEAGLLRVNSIGTYQYDALFREFITARLRARGEGPFQLVAAATADAYLRDGCFAEAIAVYVHLRDFAALGTLLSAHGFDLLDRGESNIVARALAAIPHDALPDFPGALAVKACYESLHGKFDVAEAWFRLALERIADPVQRDEIVYRFGVDLVRRERSDVIELLQPVVLGMNPEAPLAALLLALLATAYALNAQGAEAALTIDRALVLLPRLCEPGSRAKVLHQAGFVALYVHDIARAKSYSSQAYAEACASYSYDVAARALSVLYNIALDYDDDIGSARAHLAQLAELSRCAGSRQLLLYATLCSYEIEVLAGDVGQIERLDEQLHSLEVFFSVLTTETLLPAQALQAAWNGDFYRAYRLLEPSVEHQIDPDRRASRYAEIALYAAAAGLRDEASTAADQALAIVVRLHSYEKTALQTMAYVALTFVLIRRYARGTKLLDELASRNTENERIGSLVRVVRALAARWSSRAGGADLAARLEDLERHDMGGLARMLEALPLPETARGRIVQLTSAEREILICLAKGMSPQQISAAGGQGMSRIGARVASLCRKLGCADPRHAVAVALNEGLLYDAVDILPEPAASPSQAACR